MTTMPNRRQFFKTVFKVTVLTEDAPLADNVDISDVIEEMTYGHALGDVERLSAKKVSPKHIVQECIKVGNDGGFFACVMCDSVQCKCEDEEE
jgi:hypothetical protein